MKQEEKKGLVIVLSAPSGTGKGEVIRRLKTMWDCAFSVSHTTRYVRPGEIDGVHYHFVTRERFQELIEQGKMIEYMTYSGNYYGTSYDAVNDELRKGHDVLLDIDIRGGANIRRAYPDAVEIFLLPPSLEELEKRLRGRGSESEEMVCARLEQARNELHCAKDYDYIVVDRTVEQAAEEVRSILTAAKLRAAGRAELAQRLLRGETI